MALCAPLAPRGGHGQEAGGSAVNRDPNTPAEKPRNNRGHDHCPFPISQSGMSYLAGASIAARNSPCEAGI